MKTIKIIIFFSFLFLLWGCNKSDNSTNPTGSLGTIGGGLGTGGGNTGNVTVQAQFIQYQGNYYFDFVPSTTVYMTEIIANCAAAGVNNERVNVNLTSDANNSVDIDVTDLVNQGQITQGQQWNFTINGNLDNQQGTAFTASANCTVQ